MPVTSAPPVLLSALLPGATARFHDAHLDPEMARFLRAIGLTRTAELRLCKSGEPCIVQVRSTRIGLSGALAGQIYVIPLTRESA